MVEIQELTPTDIRLWLLLVGVCTVYAVVNGSLKAAWNWFINTRIIKKLRRKK